MALTQEFFAGDTVKVARSLLGKYLVRRYGEVVLAARITETEAYIGRMDKACHAYQYRKTERTNVLFAPPGTVYVYLIYGMHCCLNLVTEPEGEPAAVLIRAVEPRYGLNEIAKNRFGRDAEELTAYQRKNFLNGPGKLCAGLKIDRSLNALPFGSPELEVCGRLSEAGLPDCSADKQKLEIQVSKRIGIDYAEEAVDFPWRFTIAPKA